MVSIRTPYMFQNLVEELDRMTRDMDWAFGETTLCPASAGSGLRVAESEAVLDVDLPGVNAEDLQIELEKDTLQISAKRSDLHADEEHVVLRERTYGEFHRTYRLPWPVRPDDISATYQNGVLHVRLKKSPDAEPRRISVQRGS